MNTAYISFDPSLKSKVEAIQEQLKHRGYSVHIETSVEPEGKDFNKIRDSIDKSKVFICCVTKSYAKNQLCLNEIDYAYGIQKPKVILMFENVSYKDLDHLGFVIAGVPLCTLFEDRDKAYLKGTGPQFEQIIERLHEAIQEEEEDDDVYKSKKFELYICYDSGESTIVEGFAKKLAEEKNGLRVSYDHFRYKNKNRKTNFMSIKQSKTFLAVITKGFLKSKVCLEEITYAHRMKIPLIIVMDPNLKLDQTEIVVNTVVQTVGSADVVKDLTILDKSLDRIPFISTIEKYSN